VREHASRAFELLDTTQVPDRDRGLRFARRHHNAIESALRSAIAADEPLGALARCYLETATPFEVGQVLDLAYSRLTDRRMCQESDPSDVELLILLERLAATFGLLGRTDEAATPYEHVQDRATELVARKVIPESALSQIEHQRGILAERRSD
jgi:hypothetical protein